MKMGIIAEDDSDVAILREITSTLLKPHKIGFKSFVGHGCGKLRRKCGAWARNLEQQGCSWIVVVHDLDVHNEQQLRFELMGAVAAATVRPNVVLLPRREIESWLLYDAAAIIRAFREHERPRLPGNPELLTNPKRHLRDLIWTRYRKNYLNTVHNGLIAKFIDASLLGRSSSFRPHFGFICAVKEQLH